MLLARQLPLLVLGSSLLLFTASTSCRSGEQATGGAAGHVTVGGQGGQGAVGGLAPGGNGGSTESGGGGLGAGGAAAGGGAAGGTGGDGGEGQGGAGGSLTVRVVAGNLTSGNASSYDPGHGIRIFQGLEPDVALVQEMNYGSSSTSDIREFVDAAFGMSFDYVRESGATIPNGVVSRYPIEASGVWNDPQVSNREFVWARIALPVGVDLWAVSTHLLTTSAGDRTAEANALVDYLDEQVPAGALLVLGGDLNTNSRSEGCIGVLGGRFVTAAPYPVDNVGDDTTNAGRTEAYDWVLASPALDALEIPVAIGVKSFAHGLVFDSRVYVPLADVAPVLANDSGASGMQHMAVVRDFVIP